MKDLATTAQSTSKGSRGPSFREVYDAQVDYVGRVLVRFGAPRRDLDDLVQEVFLVVHRRRNDFDASRPIKPWLCGIAFRVASDWRRRAFQREVPGDVPETSGKVPSADRHVIAHESVQHGLAGLSFDHRAVVVLCDLEGHTAVEAAALLDVPVGTVYSRLHEARRSFVDAVRAGGAR